MTSFKGAIVHKSLEDWEDEAIDAIESTGHNPQLLAVGGLGAGVVVAGLSPISFLGLIPFILGIKAAVEVNNRRSRMEPAIEAGAYAAVLPLEELKEYAQQFGTEAAIAQIQWAKRSGVPLSDAAAMLLSRYQQKYKALPAPAQNPPTEPAPALTPERETVGATTRLGAVDTTAVEVEDYSWVDRSDLPVVVEPQLPSPVDHLLGDRLRTSLIVSVSGGGKDILLSNALRAFLAKHPGFSVIVMDCKDDPKETGYYAGLPGVKVNRLNVELANDGEVVEWVDRCLNEFTTLGEQALLINNEGTLIRAKSARYVDAISKLVTGGDSRQRYAWEAGQSAHIDDLRINGAARSRFRPMIIGLKGEEMQIEAVLSAKFVTSSARNAADIQEQLGRSPVNRAWCDGQNWYPMPELENYSGYNRDTRSKINSDAPATAPQSPPVEPVSQQEEESHNAVSQASLQATEALKKIAGRVQEKLKAARGEWVPISALTRELFGNPDDRATAKELIDRAVANGTLEAEERENPNKTTTVFVRVSQSLFS